jgi:translation machinery-associated protein 16
VGRTAFFQEAIRKNSGQPLQLDAIQTLIEEYAPSLKRLCGDRSLMQPRFVHQHDKEFATLKKERRAGRPASTREDLLRMKIAADGKEYEDGFC